MVWILREKEAAAVSKLDAAGRYDYCVKKVADTTALFGLKNENGWAIAADDRGNELFPVWPHERYAADCATGQWKSYSPAAISVDDWLSRWTFGLERDGRLAAIFPTAKGQGIAVPASRFAADLKSALAELE
ncbi:MAG TPA: DUF2750 domain-containing protein [Pirellulales bacterium]|nr:DUF2750 domain-containing protein [Pirellulales bacterium]